MSCQQCHCHIKWPLDTLGSKRDPINCEKAWLDFAVRLLSREATGKGKGQETVWSTRCKPQWWDKAITHPWKNPTANPKDTKEVLLEKYVVLESHLRAENRFPKELEEESCLWRDGHYKELFLLTSLLSLQGKVTQVHSAVGDALDKVKELNANVNESILSDIQNCLTNSLKDTDKLKVKTIVEGMQTKPSEQFRKRSFVTVDKENTDCSSAKQQKLQTNTHQTTSTITPIQSNACSTSQTQIIALAKRLYAKRNSHKVTESATKKTPKAILPRPASPQVNNLTVNPKTHLESTIETSLVSSTKSPQPLFSNALSPVVFRSDPPQLISPIHVQCTTEQLQWLLAQNPSQISTTTMAVPSCISSNLSHHKPESQISTTPMAIPSSISSNISHHKPESHISTTPMAVSSSISSNIPHHMPESQFSPTLQQSSDITCSTSPNCNLVLNESETNNSKLFDDFEIEQFCDEILNGPDTATLEVDNNRRNSNVIDTFEHDRDFLLDFAVEDNFIDHGLGSARFSNGRVVSTTGSDHSHVGQSYGSDNGYYSEDSPSLSFPCDPKEGSLLFDPFLDDDDDSFLLQKYLFSSDDQ